MNLFTMYSSAPFSPSSLSTSSICSTGSLDLDSDEAVPRPLSNYYAPFLMEEFERLFIRSSVDDSASVASHSVWDEFECNGREVELNELEQLMQSTEHGLPKQSIASSFGQLSSRSSASDDVCSPTSDPETSITENSQAMSEILLKARLIEILREREHLQRLRPKKSNKKANANKVCVFCRNNGEPETVYSCHQLKDSEGNVSCPILFIYTCPICGANGKSAHTIKYCPYNSGDLTHSDACNSPTLTLAPGSRQQLLSLI